MNKFHFIKLSLLILCSVAACKKDKKSETVDPPVVVKPGLQFNISLLPSNPNANAGAKALYSWMVSQFGKKIISGSTAEDPYFSYPKQITGKTPLLRGWDMQPYSPRYSYFWDSSCGCHTFGPLSDNPNTSDAIAWYNNNERKPVVAFTWHWHSPMGGVPGKNTFYTAETNFDASKAVIEGTEEYVATIRDIDAIAAKLKELRDAGVPILWRPLHEAGGTWFWWSAKGPVVYKKLWNIVYDRLTNYHNLDNLLWIWNGDNADWYVGDDKCDMASADTGGPNFGYDILKSEFDKVYKATKGTKIIGLSEVGVIPDPNLALSQGATWSFWMTWHEAIKNGHSETFLKSTYNSSKVITLESYTK
jgi:mannan endo-1,4-beta-mannosidase